jgi:hypothetical protein
LSRSIPLYASTSALSCLLTSRSLFSCYLKCRAVLENFAFFSLYDFRSGNFFWIFVSLLRIFDATRYRCWFLFVNFFSSEKRFSNSYCFIALKSCLNSKSCSGNGSIYCFQPQFTFCQSRANFSTLYHAINFDFSCYFSYHSFIFLCGFKSRFSGSSSAYSTIETVSATCS